LVEPGTILITGATGVVGTELVRHFLSAGNTVVASAYDEAPGASSFEMLGEGLDAGRLFTISVDLEKTTAVDEIVSFLDDKKLRPTSLVNAARNVSHLKLTDAGRPTRDGWLGEFHLDVVIAYELTMALLDQADSALESVVSIASMYGMTPPTPSLYNDFEHESSIHYGTVKAAQIHLTKELAVRLAGRNVRVNAVSLGGIEGRADEDFKKRYAKLCPQGRMLSKHEVVGAVAFLLSDGASGVTGHNLVVDGGWTVW
jgi:hypothetical protein